MTNAKCVEVARLVRPFVHSGCEPMMVEAYQGGEVPGVRVFGAHGNLDYVVPPGEAPPLVDRRLDFARSR